jgi:hypothetical protein
MAAPLLQTYDLVVGEPPTPPVRFGLNRGEIVGLLAPANGSQHAFLRVLAGLESPRAGRVRSHTSPSRVALVEPDDDLDRKLGDGPELVLVDGALDGLDVTRGRAAWDRLSRESTCGTAILVATSSAERAYRTDRLSLALWPEGELMHEFGRLQKLMQARLSEFSALVKTQRNHGTSSCEDWIHGELLRLTRAARDIAREASHISRSRDDVRRLRHESTTLSRARTDAAVRALVGERLGRRMPDPGTD